MIVSKRKLKEALIAADGNMAVAARELGISRQSVHERVRKDVKLSAVVDALQNGAEITLREISKSNVAKAILGGDLKTSQWYLDRRDADFRPNVGVRLDDAAIQAFVDGVAEAGGVDALRKIAGGG